MHSYLDAKTMAKTLRTALAERSIDVTHSDALELVARQFGLKDWNTLSARIESASSPNGAIPAGWIVHHGNGRGPGERMHRLGVDPLHPGTVLIESILPAEIIGSQFATLMQSIDATDYRGRRLRLSAMLRGESADKGAIWMRIEDAGGKTLAFENLFSRREDGPISGTVDWTDRSIVLDIAPGAATLHFGVMLKGVGRLWACDFRLDDADDNDRPTSELYPRRPNLDLGGVA
jgi:hypothetical protein